MRDRPDEPGLVDQWGRRAVDLRVSLTDRCNLRCAYCMPAEGLPWLRNDRLLTPDETVRLVRVAVERLGVTDVRFTGGEPLLRRDLEDIVAATAGLRGPDGRRPAIAVTTNGIGLDHRAERLRLAGLDRATVSLDTLDHDRFRAITFRDRFDDAIAGVKAAVAAGLHPVKLNTVLLRNINDDEVVPLVEWSCAHGVEVRFIEQMPLDAQGAWDRSVMVTAEETITELRRVFDLTEVPDRGSAPAQRWWVARDGRRLGSVGVIGAVTRPFCGDCDRTRLTADGQIRDCLFARTETDLRGLLRAGADDQAVARTWRAAMWAKKPGHGIDDPSFLRPGRPMSAIGG
ncbi:MAG: GTP 3',8-cyclase MoaA [Kineosporiaceae bacterium]